MDTEVKLLSQPTHFTVVELCQDESFRGSCSRVTQ
jgi:hypothetical protein